MKKCVQLVFITLISVGFPSISQANIYLVVAPDQTSGYDRSLFKHWIDEDQDGCDTRAEVLIEEAIKKPKISKRCSLTGGQWNSIFDGKTFRKSSQLDVDHVVPLAEAWRSGAWNWTPEKRQAFANDLTLKEALIAVSASSNRSKGDRDLASWLPATGVCNYVRNWITVKVTYGLTVDPAEAMVITRQTSACAIRRVFLNDAVATDLPSPSATPTPSTPTQADTSITTNADALPRISPGAFCARDQEGKQGVSERGVVYTCKVSQTENRLRWRQ
jgi:hypothetical protein